MMIPLCRTISTIMIWYVISIFTILLSKWLFEKHFPFPLTVTTYSNGVASLLALLVAYCTTGLVPPTRKQLLGYVLPIGFLTALEISCSNLALKQLTVSFGTILKGGGPVFTFLWGLVLGLELFNIWIALALLTIAGGIALASLGETEGQDDFQLGGFLLQVASIALGGLRWAMTHKMLLNEQQQHSVSDEPQLEDEQNGAITAESSRPKEVQQQMSPLTAVLYCSPMTATCVFPVAVALEGHKILSATHGDLHIILATITVIACLVFLLLMSEYWLVNATSSLALSVAGVFKEFLTIAGGLLFFMEHIDLLNIVGFVICQIGIGSYVFLRYEPGKDRQPYSPVDEIEEAMAAAVPKPEEFEDEKVETSTNTIL